MNHLQIRNIMSHGRIIISLSVAIVFIGFVLVLVRTADTANKENIYACNAVAKHREKLAYVSDDNQLMLYDPRSRTETTLLEGVDDFVLSPGGCVAFTRVDEADTNVYVFDLTTPASNPINISHQPGATDYPIAWSPDGRYLAYGSYQDEDDRTLHVWNGETVTDIAPANPLDTAKRFIVDWSQDDRLAFSVIHGWSGDAIPSELYLWNGKTTTNLSQNPEGWDGGARWSEDGQLLFGSERDDEYGIYVWDGVSLRNGAPNVDTFVRVAPDLRPGNPMWINNRVLGLTVTLSSSVSKADEIVLWDMDTDIIVKQYGVSSRLWSSWLAEGGQFIFSSNLASGIPSIYLDVENTEGDILFSEHVGEYSWSPDGYLAYCGIEDGYSRVLSIWNGKESWIVTRVSYEPAQWQNVGDIFSCNNG